MYYVAHNCSQVWISFFFSLSSATSKSWSPSFIAATLLLSETLPSKKGLGGGEKNGSSNWIHQSWGDVWLACGTVHHVVWWLLSVSVGKMSVAGLAFNGPHWVVTNMVYACVRVHSKHMLIATACVTLHTSLRHLQQLHWKWYTFWSWVCLCSLVSSSSR